MKPEIEIETTRDDLIAKGYRPLAKEELLERISNTTVTGDYEYSGHRIYKTFMNENGEMEGKNDWGSTEFGKWNVAENGNISIEWDGYWEDWIGMAFELEDSIKFYDVESGKWRTTFNNIVKGEHSLEV